MEHIKRIKNLLLVCLLLSTVSCRTDLVYGTRGNRIQRNYYSDYQNNNLHLFKSKKHKKLLNGKHGRLYYEFMRPFKNRGRSTRQRMPRYHNQ